MPTINPQYTIIDLMQALDYQSDRGGVCEGYTLMALQAYLCNELDVFNERVNFMLNQHQGIIKLLTYVKHEINEGNTFQNIEPEAVDIQQDIRSFCEGIEMYHAPQRYSELYAGNVRPGEIETIAKMVQPAVLEDAGGICVVDAWPAICNGTNLIEYIQTLDELAAKHQQNLALKISGHFHSIGLCYFPENQSWNLINANESPMLNIDFSALPAMLTRAYSQKEGHPLVFETTVISVANNREKIQQLIDEFKQTSIFKKVATVNYATAFLQTSDGLRFSHIVAMGGYTQLMKTLITNFQEKLSTPALNGATPLSLAALLGRADIIRLAQEHSIPLNIPDGKGLHPIECAIVGGDIETVRVLSAALLLKPTSVIDGQTLLQKAENLDRPLVIEFFKREMKKLAESKVATPPPLPQGFSIRKPLEHQTKMPPPIPTYLLQPKTIAVDEALSAEKDLAILQARMAELKSGLTEYNADRKVIPSPIMSLLQTCQQIEKLIFSALQDNNKENRIQNLKNVNQQGVKLLDDAIEEKLQAANHRIHEPGFIKSEVDYDLIKILNSSKTDSKETQALLARIAQNSKTAR